MPENDDSSPIFAGRYKFQSVGTDWDKGLSGFTHLVFDKIEECLRVIKRADINSHEKVEKLKNEYAVLLDLKGLNAPKAYDAGETKYGSTTYYYIVIEYIDGLRVVENLKSLSAIERGEIVSQLFLLMDNAHSQGIANGDLSLKHLFWKREKRQLIVIDWGNTTLNIDSTNKNNFDSDLEQAAKILSVLVLVKNQSQVGKEGLLSNSNLYPGIVPLPKEFQALIKWSPQNLTGAFKQSGISTKSLYNASNVWLKSILSIQDKKMPARKTGGYVTSSIFIVCLLFVYIVIKSLVPALHLGNSETKDSKTISLTPPATNIPTPLPLTISETPPLIVSPSLLPSTSPRPQQYSFINPFLSFDKTNSLQTCWENENGFGVNINSKSEGFMSREKDNWWYFKTLSKDRSEAGEDSIIQTDFKECLQDKNIAAVGMKAWLLRIDNNKEFGFFIMLSDNKRKDFTIWLDTNKDMFLRIRSNSNIKDSKILILKSTDIKVTDESYLSKQYEFPVEMLLTINNSNEGFICLSEGNRSEPADGNSFDSRDDNCTKALTLESEQEITKIGVVGYGSDIQSLIWSLNFYNN